MAVLPTNISTRFASPYAEPENGWEADARELEALLSLWLYNFHRYDSKTVADKYKPGREKPEEYYTLRLLGDRPVTILHYLQQFNVIPGQIDPPIVVSETTNRNPAQRTYSDNLMVHRSLVTGCRGYPYHFTPRDILSADKTRPLREFGRCQFQADGDRALNWKSWLYGKNPLNRSTNFGEYPFDEGHPNFTYGECRLPKRLKDTKFCREYAWLRNDPVRPSMSMT